MPDLESEGGRRSLTGEVGDGDPMSASAGPGRKGPAATVRRAAGPREATSANRSASNGDARTRLLVRYLGIARYASTDQIHRLLGGRPSRESLGRWLARLCASDRRRPKDAYLRRLEYRRRNGAAVPVWALAPRGVDLASDSDPGLLRRAQRHVGHQFLEHTLLLNDVLLHLVLACGSARDPGLRDLPFHWQCEASDALEFRMFHRHLAVTARTAVRPDAVLTIPVRRRRIFLEAETGTQSIRTAQPGRTGAILAKLDRYASYFIGASGLGADTWYRRAFPDGYTPRLVFLVRSEARRDRVKRAVEEWTGPVAPPQFRVVTLTFAEAGQALANYFPPALDASGAAGGEERAVRVDEARARRVEAACTALSEALAAARRAIRDHNAKSCCRLPLPPARARETRELEDFVRELMDRPRTR
jgi:hypothetical protein